MTVDLFHTQYGGWFSNLSWPLMVAMLLGLMAAISLGSYLAYLHWDRVKKPMKKRTLQGTTNKNKTSSQPTRKTPRKSDKKQARRITAEEFGQKLAQTMIAQALWEDDLIRVDHWITGVDHWVEYSQTASEIFTSPMCHGRPNYLQNLGLLEHITELRENGGSSQQIKESPRKFRQQQVFKAPTRLRELRPKTLEDKDLSGGEDQNVRRRMEICRQALKQRIKENGYHPVHYLR